MLYVDFLWQQQSGGTVNVTQHLNRKIRLSQEGINTLTYVVGVVHLSDNSSNGVCVKCFQSTKTQNRSLRRIRVGWTWGGWGKFKSDNYCREASIEKASNIPTVEYINLKIRIFWCMSDLYSRVTLTEKHFQ